MSIFYNHAIVQAIVMQSHGYSFGRHLATEKAYATASIEYLYHAIA